jgi:hypothetical protein
MRLGNRSAEKLYFRQKSLVTVAIKSRRQAPRSKLVESFRSNAKHFSTVLMLSILLPVVLYYVA